MAKTKHPLVDELPATWFHIRHLPPASGQLLVRTIDKDGNQTEVEGKAQGLHMVIEDLKFQMAQLQLIALAHAAAQAQ